MAKLVDMVAFLFSKNAGPYLITFDIVFPDDESYEHVLNSRVVSKPTIASLFGIPESRVLSIHEYPAGRIIKFTIVREHSSGAFGDRSVFGSQQWAPLIDLEVPDRPSREVG
jgi:hypothetical protein